MYQAKRCTPTTQYVYLANNQRHNVLGALSVRSGLANMLEAVENHMKNEIALGITDDQVALGSHLIHIWQNAEEFERGVRFLELGIDNESQYCVLFNRFWRFSGKNMRTWIV
jgi:hypothetical protein